jgi:hypothetical protein
MHVRLWKSHYLGRRLSDRDASNGQIWEGNLVLSATRYRRGEIVCLTLLDPGNQTSGGHLAELYEPQLIGLGNGRMRFRGIESVDGRGYAQEWLIDIA